jgi:methylmalonyl-CoA mutase
MSCAKSRVLTVSDPGGGSYYVEALTASIAKEAWKIFASGTTDRDAAISAARAAKEKAVAQRKTTLIGVNNYPDLTETLPQGATLPNSLWRMAEPFEENSQESREFRETAAGALAATRRS